MLYHNETESPSNNIDDNQGNKVLNVDHVISNNSKVVNISIFSFFPSVFSLLGKV